MDQVTDTVPTYIKVFNPVSLCLGSAAKVRRVPEGHGLPGVQGLRRLRDRGQALRRPAPRVGDCHW